jgi:hypothetical protein
MHTVAATAAQRVHAARHPCLSPPPPVSVAAAACRSPLAARRSPLAARRSPLAATYSSRSRPEETRADAVTWPPLPPHAPGISRHGVGTLTCTFLLHCAVQLGTCTSLGVPPTECAGAVIPHVADSHRDQRQQARQPTGSDTHAVTRPHTTTEVRCHSPHDLGAHWQDRWSG